MLCLCHNGPTLLRFWFQNDLGRENSAIYLKIQAGGRYFLTIVTPWSRSTSNFYALIAQNLTDEFTRKIYAASWSLFTLTAETDRVLCQLAMSGCTKWNTAAFKSLLLFMAGLFIGFWLRSTSLVKVGIRFRMASFLFFTSGLAWCVRGFKSLKRVWPYLIAFRSCISNE